MALTSADIERIQESFRKQAGALALKELIEPAQLDPVAVMLMQKAATYRQAWSTAPTRTQGSLCSLLGLLVWPTSVALLLLPAL